MRYPSPLACFGLSAGIVGLALGTDLALLAKNRTLAARVHHTLVTAAGVFATAGLISLQTRATLDLARRLEQARLNGHQPAPRPPANGPLVDRAQWAASRRTRDSLAGL